MTAIRPAEVHVSTRHLGLFDRDRIL